ncbi:alpha-amylase family glycosyl hydrolase [Streptomyces sp. NPDC052309]|uniref:glycogen debranching protein n=1 Tax=Streptomyces sp. NPDC052309 TaxID=3155421 RepID=UPI00343B0BAA
MSTPTLQAPSPAGTVRRAGRGLRVLPGDARRPGATVTGDGVVFTVYSSTARRMHLVLFDAGTGAELATLPFPDEYRTGHAFTMTVAGADPDTVHYGFRAEPDGAGPVGPVLLDPYAKALAGGEEWGRRPDYRCRIVDDAFDWQGVTRPRIAPQDLVVYELHVRGFTRGRACGVRFPGTYDGVREKIPYLRDLGVNCVELMPVFEFDETDNPFTDPASGAPLHNYWGYNPVAWFAPKAAYAADPWGAGPVRELKTLVRELHRAGIQVVLDVVLNHTAEGDHRGPVLSLRGLDDGAYYLHGPDGSYRNLTRTGNTVNANHPLTRALILDCLRYWAEQYRVDGFRFDMAPILARGQDGSPLERPPLLEAIAADPVLAGCHLIAEPFDADGLDLLGTFPRHGRWMEWNARFQYAVRRFLAGHTTDATEPALRLRGSPDVYAGHGTGASVNFVASHDGFPLADWTAYEQRHNEANGEGGGDGPHDNASWNAGHEGPTDDPGVLRLRARQVRNALLLVAVSHGVPMLAAGDESGRSQHGNNNAYCQDNETSWLDWAAGDAALLAFTRAVLAFRRAHPVLRRRDHPPAEAPDGGLPPYSLHGERPWQPGADGLLAVLMHRPGQAAEPGDTVFVAANNRPWERRVEPPPPPGGTEWRLFADTGAPPGHDIHPTEGAGHVPVPGPLTLADHSVTVLVAHPMGRNER